MNRIVDTIDVTAPMERVFDAASRVDQWPVILPHYRWVRIHEQRAVGATVVEMSANRPFGPLNWPTQWTSEMWIDRDLREVRYRHIRGVTTGMDVIWRLSPAPAGVHIDLIHDWDGPGWLPVARSLVAAVIMKIFVHGIAWRTLAGVKRKAERKA